MLGGPGSTPSETASSESSSSLGFPSVAGLCPVIVWMSRTPPAEGLVKEKPPSTVAAGEALCLPDAQARLWGAARRFPGPQGPVALAARGGYEHGRRREGRRLWSEVALSAGLTSAIRALSPGI